MAYLSKLAKATGFASTATKQCDGSPDQSSPPANSVTQTGHSPTSPTTRTSRWLMDTSPVKDAALHKVKGARVVKLHRNKHRKRSSFWRLPIVASLFDRNNDAESGDAESDDPDSNLESDLDGETIVDDEDIMDTVEEDTLLANPDEYEQHEKHQNKEEDSEAGWMLRDRHHQDMNDPALTEWTVEETWFLERLANRGREPLINRTWCLDFTWMPKSAFAYKPEQPFIQPIHCSMYRAILALHGLWKAGPLTRGQIAGGAQPEKTIYRAICDYYKWTLADGKLEHKAHIPVTAIVCAKPKEPTESVVSRLTDQLHELARLYREKWRHPKSKESDAKQTFTHPMPTLFGFMVKHTISAIVTVDSSIPGRPIRTMHTGNWNVVNQEGWHVMAVAIAMVRQRNYLMQLDAEGELGPEIIDRGDDPDA